MKGSGLSPLICIQVTEPTKQLSLSTLCEGDLIQKTSCFVKTIELVYLVSKEAAYFLFK